jgi:hypothetical protein
MAQHLILIGSLTGAYTQAQYDDGLLPRVGDTYFDQANNKAYIFLKNDASTAIAAKLAVRATTTDLANFFCRVASTTIADNELLFAGVRVSGATSLAEDEYGWFQVKGTVTMTASSDTTTANLGVCTSNQSAGQVEAAADTAAGIRGTFGVAQTTTASGDVVVKLTYNVWGV